MDKSPEAFRTISEAAEDLGLPQHVLRFWETRFPQIKPLKRGGGRRYYRPDDVELLRAVKHLLYGEGYTIKGVQRLFKEQGARAVVSTTFNPGVEPADHSPAAGGLLQSEQSGFVAPSTGDDKPAARKERSEREKPAASLNDGDLRALRIALADIIEGERVLALARSG